MEKIKLSFLGTSDSIPTKDRNHTSILLSYKNENILVDCGEGTQRQFRKAQINPGKLTSILITHWHGDHILGLPGLLQTLAMQGYSKTLKIYGPKHTKSFLEEIMKMFVFVGKIKYEVKEVEGKFLNLDDFMLNAFPLKHGTFCNGYSFIEKDKLKLNKQKLRKLNLPNSPLIKKLAEGKDIIHNNKKISSKGVTYLQKGRKISFIFDTGYSESIITNVKDSDILISESTYEKRDHSLAIKHHHLTSAQAAEIAKKAKVKKLILTHISQRYPSFFHIEKEAKKIFKNAHLVKDLEIIEI